ncbi:MAG: hypothetical protein M3Q23_02410 [Actinomycetota bacterium]|nr:hypothetical protein [Actinomycetota bacterium]
MATNDYRPATEGSTKDEVVRALKALGLGATVGLVLLALSRRGRSAASPRRR